MDFKRYLVLGSVLAALAGGIMLMSPKQKNQAITESFKPVIYVSTFSLLEAARAVAGDTIDVRSIVPIGSDAHMFSPNPSQVADISKSNLFVYNGAGFENWADNMKKILPSSVSVIDMSRYVALQKNANGNEADHEEPAQEEKDHNDQAHEAEHHDEHEHRHHGAYDPHYWLDIENMIKITQTFESELSKLFPAKAEEFQKNASGYIGALHRLKSEYETGLAECKNRTLISNHDAFGYLAHSNHLENVSVIGLSSDEQPSAQTVAHVVEVVKEHGMKTIFFEELINDNVSQTIAKETGAKAVALQPLENISEDELKSHQTYLSIMRENLKKLREAMECR